jgi:hypothetical protein
VAGNAAKDKQVRQHVHDVSSVQSSIDPDRDAFARELVDDVQHSIFPAIMGAILDEVIGPDMVGMLRPQTDIAPVVQPKPTPLRLLLWHFQPLPLPPYPLDALGVHRPASIAKHRRDAPAAIATVAGGDSDDVRGQCSFIGASSGRLPLRRAMLPQHAARQPLRYVQLRHDVIDAAATASGAQKFR